MLSLDTNDVLNLELSSDSLTLNVSSPNELDLGVNIPDRVYTSLYELAVKNGFYGTFDEWLDTFRATIAIGSVTSGDHISVTNSGTNTNAIFDFVFPTAIDYLSQLDAIILDCGSATEVIQDGDV